jgi:flavin reductase (DIM6/NTAB) family NADH-FMN oxidoreductase RutF
LVVAFHAAFFGARSEEDDLKRSLGAKPILYPAPVLVVGTYDAGGRPDLMTVAWGGICCSDPPCVAISVRAGRLTHDNLLATGDFTVNIPSERHAREADYIGIVSGRKEDKWASAGLTPIPAGTVEAPLVAEFPLALICRVREQIRLGSHTQFVGEILDVMIDETCVGADGRPDLEALRPLVYAPGVETYFGVGGAVGRAFSIGRDLRAGGD